MGGRGCHGVVARVLMESVEVALWVRLPYEAMPKRKPLI